MKKHVLNFGLVFTILILLFIGCSKDSPTSPSTLSPPPSPPKLELSKSSLHFTISSNQNSFTIKNVGDEKLIWNVAQVPQWTSVSKSNGELEKNKIDTISVIADYSGMGLGTYSDSIKVETNGDNKSIHCSINITMLPPPNGSYSGTTSEGGSISYTIDNKYINSFRGSYFVNRGGVVYTIRNYWGSFGEMSYNNSGFQVSKTSRSSGVLWVLKGTFDGDSTITGTWKHDYGTTSYTAKLQ